MKKITFALGMLSLALLSQQVAANTEVTAQHAQYQDEARCHKPKPRPIFRNPLLQRSQKAFVDIIDVEGRVVLPGANVVFDNSTTFYFPVDASQAPVSGAISVLARGEYLVVFSLTELAVSGTSYALYVNDEQVGRSYTDFTLVEAIEVDLREGDVLTLRNNGAQSSSITGATLSVSRVRPVRR